MAVTPERFAQGLTYDQFKSHMTRNQSRFQENEKRFQPAPEDVAAFTSLPDPLNVLVIAEDWCGDVIDNLPILGSLAQISGKLNLRVFLRDQNPDLIDQYLKEGKYKSIPVFAFFDQKFTEVGRFIERPDSVTNRRAERRRELFARNPEFGSPDASADQLPEEVRTRLQVALQEMRAELKPQETMEVTRELRGIAEKAR